MEKALCAVVGLIDMRALCFSGFVTESVTFGIRSPLSFYACNDR